MEVKRQVRYSVLLGRDHHDRRPRSPEDGTHKTSFKIRFVLRKIRFVLRKIRFGIRLSKVGSKVAPRLSKVGSKVEAMHCKHTTNTAPLY
jgi:hypothetical protein